MRSLLAGAIVSSIVSGTGSAVARHCLHVLESAGARMHNDLAATLRAHEPSRSKLGIALPVMDAEALAVGLDDGPPACLV